MLKKISQKQMLEFGRQTEKEEIDRDYFQNFLDHKLIKGNPYVKCISSGDRLMIDALDGHKFFKDAGDIFEFIDLTFSINKHYDDKSVIATSETEVVVSEVVKECNLFKLFDSFDINMQKIWFTEHQIICFVKKYPHWIQTGGFGTLFLFQYKGEFLVANILSSANSNFSIYYNKMDPHQPYGWCSKSPYPYRMVIPAG